MLDLDEDVFLNGSPQEFVPLQLAVIFADDAAGRLGMGQPLLHGRHFGHDFGLEQGLDGSAVRVPADDDDV